MYDSDPSKRIPKSLGTEATLVGTYTLADVAVGGFPAVVVVLLFQVVLPSSTTIGGFPVQALTLPVVALALLVGGVFVYLTPNYTSSIAWFGMMLGFYRSDRDAEHEAAREHTLVKRVHPEFDAVERTDGALVGMVRVEPASMALATEEEWSQKGAAFEDFLNTTVEFPIQIYSTTQAFPVESYLEHYRARLGEADVKANPRLSRLIEEYIAWYEADLEERRMTIRDHYVIVSVTPEGVQFEAGSLAGKLGRLPMLGLLVRSWFGPPVEEKRAAMFDALDERLGRIAQGIREIEGCSARRIESADVVRVTGEFWEGEPLDSDFDDVVRSSPILRGR